MGIKIDLKQVKMDQNKRELNPSLCYLMMGWKIRLPTEQPPINKTEASMNLSIIPKNLYLHAGKWQ